MSKSHSQEVAPRKGIQVFMSAPWEEKDAARCWAHKQGVTSGV